VWLDSAIFGEKTKPKTTQGNIFPFSSKIRHPHTLKGTAAATAEPARRSLSPVAD